MELIDRVPFDMGCKSVMLSSAQPKVICDITNQIWKYPVLLHLCCHMCNYMAYFKQTDV